MSNTESFLVCGLTNGVNARHEKARARRAFSWFSGLSGRDHSHSIINRSRKPAWLEGLAVIDKEPYRRFYRQPYAAFVDVWRWSDLRGSGDF